MWKEKKVKIRGADQVTDVDVITNEERWEDTRLSGKGQNLDFRGGEIFKVKARLTETS